MGPELLGHSYVAALCRSLYQIKIHEAMCDDKVGADIIFVSTVDRIVNKH
jgi:hypothetical protein